MFRLPYKINKITVGYRGLLTLEQWNQVAAGLSQNNDEPER